MSCDAHKTVIPTTTVSGAATYFSKNSVKNIDNIILEDVKFIFAMQKKNMLIYMYCV